MLSHVKIKLITYILLLFLGATSRLCIIVYYDTLMSLFHHNKLYFYRKILNYI